MSKTNTKKLPKLKLTPPQVGALPDGQQRVDQIGVHGMLRGDWLAHSHVTHEQLHHRAGGQPNRSFA